MSEDGKADDLSSDDGLLQFTFESMSPEQQRLHNFREARSARHAVDDLRRHMDKRFDELSKEIRTPAWKRAAAPVTAAVGGVIYWLSQNGLQKP